MRNVIKQKEAKETAVYEKFMKMKEEEPNAHHAINLNENDNDNVAK